jgi:hypothetical protein
MERRLRFSDAKNGFQPSSAAKTARHVICTEFIKHIECQITGDAQPTVM